MTSRLLTLGDLMVRLQISRAAAYRLVESGRLRGTKLPFVGWRIVEADLDRFVETHRARRGRS